MKYYSEIEAKDADRVMELSELLEDYNGWDDIVNELEYIISNIPENYKNDFEEDGVKYIKFWDQEEFISYSEIEKPTTTVNWLLNAYPHACYILSVIQIERGEYDKAYDILNKGLELEKDNPKLLSEMGLLLGRYANSTREEKYLHSAIDFYAQAFESRPYNTHGDKALALRGVGFMYIELNDLDNSEKFYESSLTWEESERARNELEIIKQKRMQGADLNVYTAGSNLNDTIQINSYEYFDEQKNKLPQHIQDMIPIKYPYTWTKASRYYTVQAEEYRAEDYFHYPLKEWNTTQIQSGVVQIVDTLKGISSEHFIAMNTMEDIENLLLTFHFIPISKNVLDSPPDYLLLEIEFGHTVDKSTIVLYFQIPAKNTEKSWWDVFEDIF